MSTSPIVLKELLAVLDKISTPSVAESWDNIGLMVGDPGMKIKGILVALDVSEEIMAEAESRGCDVIVTHHPLIFKPLQSIRTDQVTGRLLATAISKNIAIVSCHTNLDKTPGGVNDVLAASLDLKECRILAADPEDDKVGFGRIGKLDSTQNFSDFIDKLLSVLDLPAVRIAGIAPDQLTSVAVCGGSGSELAKTAQDNGAQIFITGEVKHSTARWAEDAGFCVIDAGHFSTEKLVIPALVSAIDKGCEGMGLSLPACGTNTQISPFKYYFRK